MHPLVQIGLDHVLVRDLSLVFLCLPVRLLLILASLMLVLLRLPLAHHVVVHEFD